MTIWGILVLPGTVATAFASLAHATTVKIHRWDARTPPRACLARAYPVRIAGAAYRLPAASVITVRTAGESYHFQYGQSLRSACSRAARPRAPIHATDLNLDFTIPIKWEFCRVATGDWAGRLCQKGAQAPAFPAMVNIYAPDEYDPRHLMPGPAYGRFQNAQQKARAGGHPFMPQVEGILDHYADGYWVVRNGWKNDAGEPYTMRCENTANPEVLSCETSYRLKSGPRLSYSFTAPRHSLAKAARAVDDGLHAMLAEFSRPAVPAPRKPPQAKHG
jgi:hypothetical protein